jgi:hypothetical protein
MNPDETVVRPPVPKGPMSSSYAAICKNQKQQPVKLVMTRPAVLFLVCEPRTSPQKLKKFLMKSSIFLTKML